MSEPALPAIASSREHAAINPMYLDVRAVIAKSIARIHKGNLVNHGIVPMLFEDPADYDKLEQADYLVIENFPAQIEAGRVKVTDENNGYSFYCKPDLSDAEKAVILDGGQLRHLQEQLKEMGKI